VKNQTASRALLLAAPSSLNLAENGEKRNVALVAIETQPFHWMERCAASMVHATWHRRATKCHCFMSI
jgi:hypothetical protein